jgi:hypothetical protein
MLMNCPRCGESNDENNMFCRKCAGRLPLMMHESEGGGGGPAHAPHPQAPQPAQPHPVPGNSANPYAPAQATPGRRCAQCGGTHSLQAAIGPSLGVRVFSAGRQDDVPLGPAWVCIDCGAVALTIPDDARAFLLNNTRR